MRNCPYVYAYTPEVNTDYSDISFWYQNKTGRTGESDIQILEV